VAVTPAVNPGFLALDARRRVLHVAHGDQDYLTSYRIGEAGNLHEIGRRQSEGTNPAHLALDPTGRFLLAANHTSGSVAAFPIEADGSLGILCGKVQFTGEPGPHRSDQKGSKPHQVAFAPEGDVFLVPDKGLDTVFTCALDPRSGQLDILAATRLREGSGPRHVAFHPGLPVLYSVNELDNTVSVLRRRAASPELLPLQVVPTMPDRDVRDSRAAEMAVSPDGRTLYASNRSGAGDRTPGGPGEDTIAVYRMGDDGLLTLLQHASSGGIRPRFITLGPDDEARYVATERTGSIAALARSPEGALGAPRRIAQVGSPVCIVFFERP
jgi:6-phosphogluconolactonase (cycloisomerase 2 family)